MQRHSQHQEQATAATSRAGDVFSSSKLPDGRGVTANALSFDVEDYFQVQALSDAYPRERWEACEPRVERNTSVLLDLLAAENSRATFFTLGWVAQRHPSIIRRIVAEGHELASHGYAHFRVDGQTPDQFRSDIRKTKQILEDCAGQAVRGYRAATFSVGPSTGWAFPILEEEGYAYSSSVYPVSTDYHSFPDAPRFAYRPAGTSDFWEIPITTLRIGSRNFPFGGGGYFRLMPYALFRSGLRLVRSRHDNPLMFYLHPWEVDPGQPRPEGVGLKSKFRHYLNLSRTESRLRRLLRDFRWDRVDVAFAELLPAACASPRAS
jgi:polysaccharide deacetylase family protein (PEP-CTERM system associated)